MSRFIVLYAIAGTCTSGLALFGMYRSIQMGIVNVPPSRIAAFGLYAGVFLSALQSGICWPLYLIAIALVRLVARYGNIEP